jgi:hypothetical protein
VVGATLTIACTPTTVELLGVTATGSQCVTETTGSGGLATLTLLPAASLTITIVPPAAAGLTVQTTTFVPKAGEALQVQLEHSQAISFTSTVPASPKVGDSYVVKASGGGSGKPVTFSIDPASTVGACSISGAKVSLTGAGSCVIDANQVGNATYSAAPQVQQTLTITKK